MRLANSSVILLCTSYPIWYRYYDRAYKALLEDERDLKDSISWSMDYIFRTLNSTRGPSVIDTNLS